MSGPERTVPRPSTADEFSDNVMSAVAQMPAPTPTHTFLEAIRAFELGDALSTLLVAWHLGTVRGWPIALRVRARSVALVMAVVAVLGMGTLAAAATLQVVVPLAVESAPIVRPPTGDHDPVPAGPGQDPIADPADRSNDDSTVKAGTTGNDQSSKPKEKKGSATEKDQDADGGEHDASRDDRSDDGEGEDHDAGPGASGDGDEDDAEDTEDEDDAEDTEDDDGEAEDDDDGVEGGDDHADGGGDRDDGVDASAE
jgi:hypothetical protein